MATVHSQYDCICIGSGVSGLSAALKLQKKYPSWSIALLEKYKGLGGRTYSYSPPGFKNVQWEMGAARIHCSHVNVKKLVKKYGLTLMPISEGLSYKENGASPIVKDSFEPFYVPAFLSPLAALDPITKRTHTLHELMLSVYGKEKTDAIFKEFPYYGEVYTFRGDLALDTFTSGEMSSHKNYSVIVEGYSELIKRMAEDFESKGGIILNRHSVVAVANGGGSATDITIEFGGKKEGYNEIVLRATRCAIFGLHCDALRNIKGFEKMNALQLVKTQPLYRIYAIFPKPVWFAGMERIVTTGGLRYSIPIDESKGVIMISYTDGADTEKYYDAEKNDAKLEMLVMRDVRALFPELSIPDPLFLKGHYWETGCTYWLPGDYNVSVMSREACRPFIQTLPGVYVCGESFSERQAWVEGALEHTEMCIDIVMKNI